MFVDTMKKIMILLVVFFTLFSFAFAAEPVSDEKIQVHFFYSASCPHCANVVSELDELEQKYDFIQINRYNITENFDLVMQFYTQSDIPTSEMGAVPILFVGTSYYLGDTPILENLEREILELQDSEIPINFDIDPIEDVDKEVSLMQLISLALVDAVNPCELAVLVILMTAILSRYPGEKKKALKAGLAFVSAIFIMYFLFGLLIILGFKALTGLANIDTLWFYKLLAIVAIFLGLLNIKDAIWHGGGGFVMEVPRRWRPKMKAIIQGTTSTAGAFVAGLIISFFLTPCTAGPYFVFGGILSHISFLEAIPYLLIYMVLFISPMLIITVVTYFGLMAIEDVSAWRENNIHVLHWIAGLLLLGLGIAMWVGWI